MTNDEPTILKIRQFLRFALAIFTPSGKILP
jgi:hypothetical protein